MKRFAANSSAIVSSATASALRPGARSTGIPALVAASMSTLLGSPRHEPMQLQRQVEHRALHRVGLDDEDVGALFDEPGRELLAVVEPERDVLDPRVVHDVGQRVERVPALAPERRGHQRLVSFGHASSSRVADAGVRFGPSKLTSRRADSLRPRRRARRAHHDRPARGPQRGRHGALQGAPRGVGAIRGRRPGVGRDRHRRRGGVLRGRRPQDVRARDHEVPEARSPRRASPRSTATASTTAPARCCATGRSTSR